MPSYADPNPQYVRALCRLNELIFGLDEDELDDLISARMGDAKTQVRLVVTESRFDSSSLTATEVDALQQAVGWRVAADILRGFALEVATGTNQPHRIDPELALALVKDFTNQANVLARNVASGAGAEVRQVLTGFDSDSPEKTFTRAMRDRW